MQNEIVLVINIGNTNITCGLYKNNKLLLTEQIPTVTKNFKKYKIFAKRGLKCVIISSVVPEVTRFLKKIFKEPIFEIRHGSVNIKNLYYKRSEVGIDRLITAYSAKEKYCAPLIVIDFGTAITFNVVSKKGEFIGGLILPGIGMWGEFLYRRTAKLPKVKFLKVSKLIGRSTRECMNSGIFFGNVELVKGLIRRLKRVTGRSSKVIATGGLAKAISPYIREIDEVDENLILNGMMKIYETGMVTPWNYRGRL